MYKILILNPKQDLNMSVVILFLFIFLGLGLNILADTVRMVKPDLVIQLMASNLKMPLIDTSFLCNTPSLNALQVTILFI